METEKKIGKFFKHIMIEKDNGTILMIKMAKMNYLVLTGNDICVHCVLLWLNSLFGIRMFISHVFFHEMCFIICCDVHNNFLHNGCHT